MGAANNFRKISFLIRATFRLPPPFRERQKSLGPPKSKNGDPFSIVKGVEKKTCTFENHSYEIFSPATHMIGGWYIFYMKGGTHSSVLSTKTSLYDIRSPRYKQNKIGYQI